MSDANTQGIRAFLEERWPDLEESALAGAAGQRGARSGTFQYARYLRVTLEGPQAFADDQSLTVGMGTRLFITGILGVAFAAVPVWRTIESPSKELSGPMVQGAPIIYGAIFTSLPRPTSTSRSARWWSGGQRP